MYLSRSKYGIGKLIFNHLYVHRTYIDQINDSLIRSNIQIAMKDIKVHYDVIRYNIKENKTTFIIVADFDSSQEPLPDKYISVKDNGEFTFVNGTQIWHHKWMMVGDDYFGFDVEQSKARSKLWTETMKVDYKKIGQPKYWDLKLKEFNLEGRK